VCTDYRARGRGLLDPASKGKGCEEGGTGDAHQQLLVELVLTTGFWVLQPQDPVCRACLGEMGSIPLRQDKCIFASRMADLESMALY